MGKGQWHYPIWHIPQVSHFDVAGHQSRKSYPEEIREAPYFLTAVRLPALCWIIHKGHRDMLDPCHFFRQNNLGVYTDSTFQLIHFKAKVWNQSKIFIHIIYSICYDHFFPELWGRPCGWQFMVQLTSIPALLLFAFYAFLFLFTFTRLL